MKLVNFNYYKSMQFSLSILMSIGIQLCLAAKTQYESAAHITGGEPVRSRTQYPFYVQIYVYDSPSSNRYNTCGGTILSSSYIITAAHCLHDNTKDPSDEHWRDPGGMIVYSGDITKDRLDEQFTSQEHRVKNVQKLDNFLKPTREGVEGSVAGGYDVAVLELEKPLQFDEYRQPLTPCRDEIGANNPHNWTVRAIGLGVTNTSTWAVPDFLMQVDLVEIEPDYCQDLFVNSSHPEGSLVCHNYQDKDTCYGDTGSALFLAGNQDEALCLYGLSSYGIHNREDPSDDCGHPEYPTVAARVSYYIDMFNLSGLPIAEDANYPESIEEEVETATTSTDASENSSLTKVTSETTVPTEIISEITYDGDKSIISAAHSKQINFVLLLFIPLLFLLITARFH